MNTPSNAAAITLDVADELLIDAEAGSLPAQQATPVRNGAASLLLGASLVLIAFNLRPVFSSASALLPEIRSELGLSALGASLLTTLPVVCLGVFPPLAPRLAQRIGTERTLLGVLLLLALGTALRGLFSVPLLFIGTALAGACIAVGNVLLPGLVKRDFPTRAALMTGFYTMALCAGAAGAAGLTLPIEHALGGSLGGALAVWALPALAVGLIWLPQVLRSGAGARRNGFRVDGLWRDRLAWQVTLFMGLQSALAYCVFGWLVPILRERGLDGVTAGAIVSLSVMVQAASCLVVPHIAVRGRDQRLINAGLCGVAVMALLGLLFAPLSSVWLWAVLQGIGQGGLIAAAMTTIVLRSRDPDVAAHLSGMAQCVGYLLAAIGPLIVGLIRGWTGSFSLCAVLFIALGLGAAINGWRAGRALEVNVHAVEKV
ncbi:MULTISPECIES: CynX/NimT family MFS transporter [Rhizobium]|uniref:CynX/NimT family MFS transporter n=1 Tax=Rhizobium TaxID=379 RepID=UPI0007E9B6F2|nr:MULTISPECIES: MFS transporter [Rhizobium]ANK89897.1 major facilitator superfamily protein [Rhizobium sp. N6212]ANK95924.1 major facilitator superfamily protein [Rhizobium sp. N621]ANL01952.1 major facilitator superfamily protein [Rhizobium esperanzae]ANL08080.1 major facilitator superfamily protein [Rhizobium sp. N1341]ANL20126.1 major facilitator superfamily protein [Rhizobium sp. N113]